MHRSRRIIGARCCIVRYFSMCGIGVRYVPYGDLANHTFVEPSAASGIVCSLWWGQFVFRFCAAFHVGCARERGRSRTHSARVCVRACMRVCVRACVRSPSCLYTRRELRMSLVTPGVTSGFALTVPSYQHRPPRTTDREAPLYTPNDTRLARETLSHAVALFPTLWDITMILFASTWSTWIHHYKSSERFQYCCFETYR